VNTPRLVEKIRAKFEEEPVWWLPGDLALAAVLNGLFTTLCGELTTTRLGLTGGGFNPWPGLILATIVAGATLGILFYLIRRANRLTLAATGEGEMLRLVDPATGEKLLTPLEAQAARRRAEAEVERLRAELARLRTGERPLGKR